MRPPRWRSSCVAIAAFATASVAACRFTAGDTAGDGPHGGSGSDGGHVDAKPVDAMPDAPLCKAPGISCSSDDTELINCTAPGQPEMVTSCGWGCVTPPPIPPMGPPHCAVLMPAGGEATMMDTMPAAFTGLGDFTLGNGATVDTSGSGTITSGSGTYAVRTAMGNVPVFRFGTSLTITGTPTVTGSNPVILVVDGPITVDGVVALSGTCGSGSPGPGGGSGGAPQQNGHHTGGGGDAQGGGFNDRGGGGGGYGGNGGSGGTGNAASLNDGGPSFGTDGIAALTGGGGGAGGANNGTDAAYGGGGGGAIQLISNTGLTISASAGINGGGCGGENSVSGGDGGGGGGAGGTILIEAPIVTFATGAILAVNGGAGGGIAQGNNNAVTGGQLGSAQATNANGGGSGGAGTTADGSGGASQVNSAGGGGGGAVGRMRFNTRAGGQLYPNTSTLSPPLTTGTTCTAGAGMAM